MYTSRRNNWLRSVILGVIAVMGCSRGPTAVKVPPIQPEISAEEALSQYDKNSDGLLAADELAGSPALLDALKKDRVDADGDNRFSKQELIDRFATWANGGIGVSYLACRVTRAGRPLAGAEVKFVPEDIFREVLQPATGVTTGSGMAIMGIDKSNLPADLQNLRGVQQGLYRVEITHPNIQIPPKYNTETTLGIEVSYDYGGYLVSFNL